MMTEDIAQAISIELGHILKPDWSFKEEEDRFVVSPPNTIAFDPGKTQIILDEVWRIARFVAYANFSSISRSGDGSFVIASHMPSGNGFRIIFTIA
jgi:hypothetical protein